MKSFLIFCGLLNVLSQISGVRFEKKWASRPQENATEICSSAPSWTLLSHQGDCRKFYACVNHVAEEFYCAEGHNFDRVQLRCMPGACHDTPIPSAGCQPHAVARVATDCSAFSYCNGDGRRRSVEQCPPGSYYHAGYGMCLAISMTADHKCACLLPERTTLANPDDCETYFVCVEGRAKLQQCPRGQYYEAAVSGCLPDLTEKCLMAPTMSSMEALTLKGVCQQATMAGKIFQPVAEDCGKFYLCLQGRVFTKQCGKGFYFDREWNYCRLDVERKCSGRLNWKQQNAEMAWTQPQAVEKVEKQNEDDKDVALTHFSIIHQKEQVNDKIENKENKGKNEENTNKHTKKQEKDEKEKNTEKKKEENEEQKTEIENNKYIQEKKEKDNNQKEMENMKVKDEHIEKKNITEGNKIEIQHTSSLEDNKEAAAAVPHNNNYKKEREVLNGKEKQTEETKQQQKPTPTKTANDKLFSKFIKFE